MVKWIIQVFSCGSSWSIALYVREILKLKVSLLFLQGTQSANPHNDYCQHFVDTGQRPQNFIRDVGLADRFEEYPKLRELIKLKVRKDNLFYLVRFSRPVQKLK